MNASPPGAQAAITARDAGPAPQLDPQQVAMLRGLRKGALLPQLLRTYSEQVPQQLAGMAAAAAAGDLASLGGVAHSLKSASYSIGATRMGDLCAAIETAARHGDNSQGPVRCAALSAAWDCLRPELEGHLAP
jgi:HPt (histidine-containing phosphotransfer) domain-containing protein